jgi:hydroxymethylpyrimidine/phosphomethylpyrimidine kinase
MTAIAALTAQNTVGVQGVFPVAPDFVVQQMDSVLDDIGAHAIKTGMLATRAIISSVRRPWLLVNSLVSPLLM